MQNHSFVPKAKAKARRGYCFVRITHADQGMFTGPCLANATQLTQPGEHLVLAMSEENNKYNSPLQASASGSRVWFLGKVPWSHPGL